MFFNLLGITNFWLFLVEFCVAASLVLLAGSKLAVYGDKIAEKSGLTHGWIGFILLASITSIPELMTGISSTAIVGSVDLVMSDTLGSNAFNLIILAFLFLFVSNAGIKLKIEEMMSGFSGLILLGFTSFFLFFEKTQISDLLSWIFSGILFVSYLLIVYHAYKAGALSEEEQVNATNEKGIGIKFSFFSIIIILSAIWMTKSAGLISVTKVHIGNLSFVLGETFVGALLLSIATSLPELSVTFASARIGQASMAVGNIFGSNIFNIFIIPISAIFYKGNFWKEAGSG
ncbi:MAG: hypothetical protein D6707_09995, partial [Bacteroidetes bacterium]